MADVHSPHPAGWRGVVPPHPRRYRRPEYERSALSDLERDRTLRSAARRRWLVPVVAAVVVLAAVLLALAFWLNQRPSMTATSASMAEETQVWRSYSLPQWAMWPKLEEAQPLPQQGIVEQQPTPQAAPGQSVPQL